MTFNETYVEKKCMKYHWLSLFFSSFFVQVFQLKSQSCRSTVDIVAIDFPSIKDRLNASVSLALSLF